jgi:ferredoxin
LRSLAVRLPLGGCTWRTSSGTSSVLSRLWRSCPVAGHGLRSNSTGVSRDAGRPGLGLLRPTKLVAREGRLASWRHRHTGVHDPRAGSRPLGHLMSVVRGRRPGADVQELADALITGQIPDRMPPAPPGVPSQHRILMPEREHLGRCRVVAASQHDDQAEYPADQQLDDLEQHPPNQPSGCPACRQQCRSKAIEYSSDRGSLNGSRAMSCPRSLHLRPDQPGLAGRTVTGVVAGMASAQQPHHFSLPGSIAADCSVAFRPSLP